LHTKSPQIHGFSSPPALRPTSWYLVSSPRARTEAIPKIRAIALDGLSTSDLRPVFALAENLFPGKGTEFDNTQAYASVRVRLVRDTNGGCVVFCHVTEDALVYAAKLLKIELTVEKGNQRIQAFLSIKAWPDALPALQSLKASGMKMALPSNFTPAMLDAALRSSGLQGII
jgi:2-haloacid dehalogenase